VFWAHDLEAAQCELRVEAIYKSSSQQSNGELRTWITHTPYRLPSDSSKSSTLKISPAVLPSPRLRGGSFSRSGRGATLRLTPGSCPLLFVVSMTIFCCSGFENFVTVGSIFMRFLGQKAGDCERRFCRVLTLATSNHSILEVLLEV